MPTTAGEYPYSIFYECYASTGSNTIALAASIEPSTSQYAAAILEDSIPQQIEGVRSWPK